MLKKRWLILISPLAIFIGISFLLWMGLQRNPREIPSPLLNKPVPAFSAPSLQNPQRLLTQRNLQGQITLLNVFATWCVSCQAEHVLWMEIRDQLPSVKIIGLDYKDERKKALNWLQQYGNPYDEIIDDPKGDLGINWGVYGTPETFIVDKEGIIRYKYIGALSAKDWRQVILREINKIGDQ
jgi:cytochrome c biogenesis protein CcmG, thiol:disulfide interchange protein DsbE